MTFQDFLKNLDSIEQSDIVVPSSSDARFFGDIAIISWQLAHSSEFELYYCFNGSGASIYFKDVKTDRKLHEMELKAKEDPLPKLLEMRGMLET